MPDGSTTPNPGGFVHLSRAWYADANLPSRDFVDEVAIGDYNDGPGVADRGEFTIRWYELQGCPRPVPKLGVFDEAWGWLIDPTFRPLLDWLAENRGKEPTPEEVCEVLVHLGFVDHTPEQQQ